MGQVPLGEASIGFLLERWESHEEAYLEAVALDRQPSEALESKIDAWFEVVNFEPGRVPAKLFQRVARGRYIQARDRAKLLSEVVRARKAQAAARERNRRAQAAARERNRQRNWQSGNVRLRDLEEAWSKLDRL